MTNRPQVESNMDNTDNKDKRIGQQDILPSAVKTRHMGEPNRFIRAGLAKDRPTPETAEGGLAIYYETDTKKLKIYDGTAWREVTLT